MCLHPKRWLHLTNPCVCTSVLVASRLGAVVCTPHPQPFLLLQFELYSARVKDFEVRGRQSHPRNDGLDYGRGLNSTNWKLLGNFTAEKTKGTRAHVWLPSLHACMELWHAPCLLLYCACRRLLFPCTDPARTRNTEPPTDQPPRPHPTSAPAGKQWFGVEQPMWVRFLLFRFLTHHGSEPVCAINGINVFGKETRHFCVCVRARARVLCCV